MEKIYQIFKKVDYSASGTGKGITYRWLTDDVERIGSWVGRRRDKAKLYDLEAGKKKLLQLRALYSGNWWTKVYLIEKDSDVSQLLIYLLNTKTMKEIGKINHEE